MTNYFIELGKMHAKDLRPTDEKSSPLSFQLSEKDFKKLEFYCEKMSINKTKFVTLIIKQKLIFALAQYLHAKGLGTDSLDLSNMPFHQRAYIKARLSLAMREIEEFTKS